MKDRKLSLIPPTTYGIWTKGEVNAAGGGFHFAKAWRTGEPRSTAWSRMNATVARCVGGDTTSYVLHRWRRPLYRG